VEEGLHRIEEAGLEGIVGLIHGDVCQLDRLLKGRVFDAVYTTWTTIMGYGLSKDCSELALRKAGGGEARWHSLVIVNTPGYDRIGLRQASAAPG